MPHSPDRPLKRTRLESVDLALAWEEHAAAFIAWARQPGHDSYWLFHRDQFLDLVPPPGRLTLDLGCGEGRLSRDLKAIGHHVVAVDLSPTMLAAAREADADLDTAYAGRFAGDDASSPYVIEGSYFERARYADNFVRDGLEMTFVSERRPIEAYVDALAARDSWSSGSARPMSPTRGSCGIEVAAGSGSHCSSTFGR